MFFWILILFPNALFKKKVGSQQNEKTLAKQNKKTPGKGWKLLGCIFLVVWILVRQKTKSWNSSCVRFTLWTEPRQLGISAIYIVNVVQHFWSLGEIKMSARFFRVTLFGGFKWPFQGLSDLHLGDQRVTWKKLVIGFLGGLKTDRQAFWPPD